MSKVIMMLNYACESYDVDGCYIAHGILYDPDNLPTSSAELCDICHQFICEGDDDKRFVEVRWQITPEWEYSMQLTEEYGYGNIPDDEEYYDIHDESNACDWDTYEVYYDCCEYLGDASEYTLNFVFAKEL